MVLKDSLMKKSNLFITAFSFSNLDKIVAQERCSKLVFVFLSVYIRNVHQFSMGKCISTTLLYVALSLPMSLALDVQTRDV